MISDIKKKLEKQSTIKNVAVNKDVDGKITASFDIEVDRPSRGLENLSISKIETVIFDFPKLFPIKAPKIKLRADFPKNLAHIQPQWDLSADYVEPCIIYDNLDSFYSSHGLSGIIDRLQKWLNDAAWGTLRTKDEYWEPMRRDGLKFTLLADQDKLSSNITDNNNLKFIPIDLYTFDDDYQKNHGLVHDKSFSKLSLLGGGVIDGKFSLLILSWAQKSKINSEVWFDKPMSLRDLITKSKEIGCFKIETAINDLRDLMGSNGVAKLSVFFVLTLRRPKKLQGQKGKASNCEFVPFWVNIIVKEKVLTPSLKTVFELDYESLCLPANIIDILRSKTQEQLSGYKYNNENEAYFVGAGSLGSKLIMHLAKSGFDKFNVCENSLIRPHNNVRMGYISFPREQNWKSKIIERELSKLEYTYDFKPSSLEGLLEADIIKLPENVNLLINTTASITVQNLLISKAISPHSTRVLTCSFYSKGRVGFIGLTGKDGNPNNHDVLAQFWSHWANKSKIEKDKFWSNSELTEVGIGQGCSSTTMAMSDSQSSLLAAGMAEYTSRLLEMNEFPDKGALFVGTSDFMSVNWDDENIKKTINVKNNDGWQVSITEKCDSIIKKDVEAWGKKETGGYILGYVNKITKNICITDIVAPPMIGTIRKTTEFTPGIEGIRPKLEKLQDCSILSIQPLGTWHSHPLGGGESSIDKNTLFKLAKELGGEPACLLIWRPEGYKGIIKEF